MGNEDAGDLDATVAAERSESLAEAELVDSSKDGEGAAIGRHPLAPSKALAFLLAGRAILTLQNEENGTRRTYRFELAKDRDDGAPRPYFVSVLVGSNNEDDYAYLGTLWTDGGIRYSHGRKSKVGEDTPSAKGAAWLIERIASGRAIDAPMAVYHEGRCAACGRLLTVPESIESGLGPVCAQKGSEP